MKRGGKIVCGAAVLAVAACGGHRPELGVRPIPTKLAEGERPVPFRIAEATGQLALGNVALALESFRKAQREDPTSIEALLGIATCYDRMGRFDLSRRNYEAALAIAPANAGLLEALAASLDLQGKRAEAASVRAEIAGRSAAASLATAPEPPMRAAMAAEAAVAAPPQMVPLQQVAMASPADAARAFSEGPAAQLPPVSLVTTSIAAVDVPPLPLPVMKAAETPTPQRGSTVTIKLPPPRPAPAPVAKAEAKPVPSPAKIEDAASRTSEPVGGGPRIERLSMVEVALITASGPRWRVEPVSRSARSATVRFVPLRSASTEARVQLLNAARVHRLAARTRAYLAGRGWRSIAIGDAESTRARSIIYYPAGERVLARRLSAQFGFAMAPHRDFERVTVLLGRDSVRIAGARAGG